MLCFLIVGISFYIFFFAQHNTIYPNWFYQQTIYLFVILVLPFKTNS